MYFTLCQNPLDDISWLWRTEIELSATISQQSLCAVSVLDKNHCKRWGATITITRKIVKSLFLGLFLMNADYTLLRKTDTRREISLFPHCMCSVAVVIPEHVTSHFHFLFHNNSKVHISLFSVHTTAYNLFFFSTHILYKLCLQHIASIISASSWPAAPLPSSFSLCVSLSVLHFYHFLLVWK